MKTVKATLLNGDAIKRTITRLAHEIIENNSNINEIAIVGIRTRGEFLANGLRLALKKLLVNPLIWGP